MIKNWIFFCLLGNRRLTYFYPLLSWNRILTLYKSFICVCVCFYKRHSHTCTLFVRVKYFLGLYKSLCLRRVLLYCTTNTFRGGELTGINMRTKRNRSWRRPFYTSSPCMYVSRVLNGDTFPDVLAWSFRYGYKFLSTTMVTTITWSFKSSDSKNCVSFRSYIIITYCIIWPRTYNVRIIH